MIRASLLAVALLVTACGGKSAPPPTEPAPAADCGLDPATNVPTTAEQCECAGLTVVGDIGDGQVACPDGLTEVSRISYGIEGGLCCQPGTGS